MPQKIITTVTCRQCGKQFTAGKYTRFFPDFRNVRELAINEEYAAVVSNISSARSDAYTPVYVKEDQ